MDEEHRQAARRRAWAKREEERTQEERRAIWHANVRTRGLIREQLIISERIENVITHFLSLSQHDLNYGHFYLPPEETRSDIL